MKKILFSLFCLSALSLCAGLLFFEDKQTVNSKITTDFQIKDVSPGNRQYSMYVVKDKNSEFVGSLNIVEGKNLAIFASSAFDVIDTSLIAPSAVRIINVMKTLKATTKQDLNKLVMLGDIHIAVAHRGKGFAQQLVNKACQYCFDEGATMVVLIPDPFEYENGQQKSLENSPDYEAKKQRLINLYQKCGFSIDKAGKTLFMYRKA